MLSQRTIRRLFTQEPGLKIATLEEVTTYLRCHADPQLEELYGTMLGYVGGDGFRPDGDRDQHRAAVARWIVRNQPRRWSDTRWSMMQLSFWQAMGHEGSWFGTSEQCVVTGTSLHNCTGRDVPDQGHHAEYTTLDAVLSDGWEPVGQPVQEEVITDEMVESAFRAGAAYYECRGVVWTMWFKRPAVKRPEPKTAAEQLARMAEEY